MDILEKTLIVKNILFHIIRVKERSRKDIEKDFGYEVYSDPYVRGIFDGFDIVETIISPIIDKLEKETNDGTTT